MDRICLKINPAVDNIWLEDPEQDIRITIDFETINSSFDDFSQLPVSNNSAYLFMIGVSYKIPSKPIKYKMFVISELTIDAEFQMILQFYNFLRQLTDIHVGKGSDLPVLYYWGHFEQSQFDNICAKINRTIGLDVRKDIDQMQYNLNFYDLADCFKKNPIVINGCFKFGLKEISNRLYQLGLIKTIWAKNNPCAHGNTAMVLAHKAYSQSNITGQPVIKMPSMKNIMDYNRVDCVVLHDIIDLLIKKARIFDIIE